MSAKTAFSPGLGQGPAPPSRDFTEGPRKVSLQAKVTRHLPSEAGIFLPFGDHWASSTSPEEAICRGLRVRSEVGAYKRGCVRTPLGLKLWGRAPGGRAGCSGSEKPT